uniref:Ubiquitin-conjugating enzyme E2 J2 n=1 Tax=Franklinothrips vespiformis TaxID=297892 RepID=A0A481SWY4_FRAVS|nr:ubiquitin-conjugating enzyme E2 j2 [Franklinothrips vespiformis]
MANGKTINATSRLQQDYLRLKKDPVPYIIAEPLPSNICEWHYVVCGPEATPYEGGLYHGKLVFPRQFPFKPPSIYMITPNGRFKTNTRLCLSISDYHPDTWNPAWSVSTILTGLLSFMVERTPTLGSMDTSDYEKQQLAHRSLEFNLNNSVFCELFPDLAAKVRSQLARRAEMELQLRSLEDDSTGPDVQGLPLANHHMGAPQSTLHSAISNLFVLVGLAAFAYIVKCVVRSLSTD